MCTAPRPRMGITGYVHNFYGAAELCTLGVRLRKRAYRFTSPCEPRCVLLTDHVWLSKAMFITWQVSQTLVL